MGGVEVDDADRGRLVDIPLPDGAHGIYEDLHGFSNGSALTDELKARCRIYYGIPIRVFLSKLLIRLPGKVRALKDGLQKLRDQYLKQLKKLTATGRRSPIRSLEPFAAVIFCTSDPHKADAKTRSKWSRALRYAERFKPDTQSLTQFIKSQGGINECAARWSLR